MSRAFLSSLVATTVLALGAACTDPPQPKAAPPAGNAPHGATLPVASDTVATSDLVPVHADDPVRGPKSARVTIVVWSDFQCPFCSRVEPTLTALRERYGDDLRIVWKDEPLPFHKFARAAAVVGRIVYTTRGAGAFWAFHDTVFDRQKELSADNLLAWAQDQGVGPSELEAGRAAAEAKVDASMAEATRLGLSGTPAFMIDGVRLVGSRPLAEFTALVDAHLAEAKALEQKGVPSEGLYDALVRAHYTAPTPDADEDAQPTIDPTVWKVVVGDAPVRGPADAPVTLVVFADFQCPFCKREQETLRKLDAEFPGKLRFVFKHAPLSFHQRAVPAANLAIEARKEGGDVAFWKAHDALFASTTLENDDLERIAGTIGIDPKKAMAAVGKDAWQAEIDRDLDQGESLKVSGTPCTFVNGRKVEGAQPIAVFEGVVRDELQKAQQKIAAGTPAAKVYDEIIANGKAQEHIDLPVPAGAAWKGGAKAKVVLQVFSDFQCPFCKRLEVASENDDGNSTGALARIEKKYGDKIKIVWRDFPLSFHTRARAAATLAREALSQKGNATFWKVHDDLFAAQPDLSDEKLEEIAKKHKLDWKKVRAAIDTDKWKAAIDDDMKDGGTINISGTPAVLVDGKLVVGAQGDEAFTKVIDRALAKYGVAPPKTK